MNSSQLLSCISINPTICFGKQKVLQPPTEKHRLQESVGNPRASLRIRRVSWGMLRKTLLSWGIFVLDACGEHFEG